MGHKSLFFLVGKLRQAAFHLPDPVAVDDQRQQVRIGKIAIVMGLLFAAHGERSALFGIPQPGFLYNQTAVQEGFLLPADFILQRLFDMFEGV